MVGRIEICEILGKIELASGNATEILGGSDLFL